MPSSLSIPARPAGQALEQDELLTGLASARAEFVPQARTEGLYTDEDNFAIVS